MAQSELPQLPVFTVGLSPSKRAHGGGSVRAASSGGSRSSKAGKFGAPSTSEPSSSGIGRFRLAPTAASGDARVVEAADPTAADPLRPHEVPGHVNIQRVAASSSAATRAPAAKHPPTPQLVEDDTLPSFDTLTARFQQLMHSSQAAARKAAAAGAGSNLPPAHFTSSNSSQVPVVPAPLTSTVLGTSAMAAVAPPASPTLIDLTAATPNLLFPHSTTQHEGGKQSSSSGLVGGVSPPLPPRASGPAFQGPTGGGVHGVPVQQQQQPVETTTNSTSALPFLFASSPLGVASSPLGVGFGRGKRQGVAGTPGTDVEHHQQPAVPDLEPSTADAGRVEAVTPVLFEAAGPAAGSRQGVVKRQHQQHPVFSLTRGVCCACEAPLCTCHSLYWCPCHA
jgi:hypothetical protein